MKVLILNSSDKAIGGTEIYSGQLAAKLREVGYEATLASRHWVQGPPIGDENPVIVDRRAALHKLLANFKPDVIHINNPEAWFIDLSLLRRYATVVFLHSPFPLICPGDGRFHRMQQQTCERRVGPYCIIAPWRHRCGNRNVLRQSANLALAKRWQQFAPGNIVYTGASSWTCDQLAAEGFKAEQIFKTPLGLPTQEFDLGDAATQMTSPIPTVLFVGRMISVKGAAHLLEALQHVDRPTNTIMVGDGPERPKLMSYANERLPDHHNVEFVGWQTGNELEAFRRRARFTVMPSMWPEPFGLVGLESFRAGRPVIAYRTGGMGEWLRDKSNGLFVEPGNIVELGRAISRLIEDRDYCEKLGQQGAKDQASQFTFEAHWQAMSKAYDLALAKGGAAKT